MSLKNLLTISVIWSFYMASDSVAATQTPEMNAGRHPFVAEFIHTLRQQGWQVFEDNNGNIILRQFKAAEGTTNPTGTDQSSAGKETVERESTAGTSEKPMGQSIARDTPATRLYETLINTHGSQFWQTQLMPDGSLRLYSLSDTLSGNSENPLALKNTRKMIANPYQSKPVSTSQAAALAAQDWIDGGELVGTALVGKIRSVPRAYMVSIVSNRSPHKLLNLIAVRSRDGRIIVID